MRHPFTAIHGQYYRQKKRGRRRKWERRGRISDPDLGRQKEKQLFFLLRRLLRIERGRMPTTHSQWVNERERKKLNVRQGGRVTKRGGARDLRIEGKECNRSMFENESIAKWRQQTKMFPRIFFPLLPGRKEMTPFFAGCCRHMQKEKSFS